MKNFNLIRSDEQKKIKDLKKTYVTGYYHDKKHSKIIVKFADGNKLSYPYTSKIEEQILSKMENQVLEASNSETIADYEKFGSDIGSEILLKCCWGIPMSGILYFIGAIAFLDNFLLLNLIGLTSFCVGSIMPISIIKSMIDYIKEKIAVVDYKKSKFFLDNKQLISYYSLKEKSILKGVSLDGKFEIKSSNGVINVNNVSDMSLEDLRRIKKNIEDRLEREKMFDSLPEEKGKQLVKTK